MRKKITYVVFALFLFLSIASCVYATDTPVVLATENENFAATTNNVWVQASVGDRVKSWIHAGNTKVNWKFSSQTNRHNQYFRIVNSNGEERGHALISYLDNTSFESYAEASHYYYLQTRRENSVDPMTTVSGTWRP